METELIRYQKLAKAVIEFAVQDLNHPNAQIRATAHSFFTDPNSRLSHWCEVLGLDIHEVRRYKKSLDKNSGAVVASEHTGGYSII
jgi:hypothetical protein